MSGCAPTEITHRLGMIYGGARRQLSAQHSCFPAPQAFIHIAPTRADHVLCQACMAQGEFESRETRGCIPQHSSCPWHSPTPGNARSQGCT